MLAEVRAALPEKKEKKKRSNPKTKRPSATEILKKMKVFVNSENERNNNC
jgi:hypothetical protein